MEWDFLSCLLLCGSLLCAIVLLWKWQLLSTPLRAFPGPPAVPIFGNILQHDWEKPRLTYLKWTKQYGPVYRIRVHIGDILVVSDIEVAYEVLVRNGHLYSDRTGKCFRLNYITGRDTVLFQAPNRRWKLAARKLSHNYLKQFGTGLSRLESILMGASEYMITEFESAQGDATDVMSTLKNAALGSISVLLLGEWQHPSQPLHGMLLKYDEGFVHYLGVESMSLLLLDIFPSLLNFPLKEYRGLRQFMRLQDQCWESIKMMHSEGRRDSLTQVLLEHVQPVSDGCETGAEDRISEKEAQATCLSLIFAGVRTTSLAMYMLLNTLAFREDVQERIRKEMEGLEGDADFDHVTLAHRSKMPYLRAAILECLRHFGVATLGGINHIPLSDAILPGYGTIPKGTDVMINTWALHHDESFWGDPDIFRPERFLDDVGELLPPDHPNRKQLLPFGAGPRVCLGEAFAMARLFLWTAAVVRKFKITVAQDSDPDWMNPDTHGDNVFLKPAVNKIKFSLLL